MFCSGFAALTDAQPVLQNTVFPAIGNVITTVSADSNIIAEGNAGANQIWDFTALEAVGDPQSTTFVDAAGTPNAATFPASNIAGVTTIDGADLYAYYKLSPNQFSLLGTAYPGVIPQQYSNPETLLATPLNFNGTFTDNFASTQPFPDASLSSSGNKTVTYDAYGTLKMPGGTFNNAMRLETVTQKQDTTSLFFGFAVTNTTQTNYEWYVNGRPAPQVTIVYTEGTSTTFFPSIPPIMTDIPLSKAISFVSSISTGVEENPAKTASLSLVISGANPVSNQLRLTATAAQAGRNYHLQLMDAQGKIVQSKILELAAGDNFLSFSVGYLPAGTYFVQLSDGSKSITVRWARN